MAKNSLLEKAKELEIRKFNKTFTNEEIELVEAWLNNTISLAQLSRAIDMSFNQAYTFIAQCMKYTWNNKGKK